MNFNDLIEMSGEEMTSYILSVTAFALNDVNKVFGVVGNVVSDRSWFTCAME